MTESRPSSTPEDRSSSARRQSLSAFGLYLAIAVVLLDRGLIAHWNSHYIGCDTDPLAMMWFFRWWMYAFSNRINPFFTDLLWAPRGINLTWTTFVPLPAWVSIPLQLIVGEPASYNI